MTQMANSAFDVMVIVLVVVFGWVAWSDIKFHELTLKCVAEREAMPLPSSVSAYSRLPYLVMLSCVSGWGGLVFTRPAIDTWSGASSVPFYFYASCAGFFYLVAANYIKQIVFDTRVSPFGRPVLQLSNEGITLKNKWEIRWTDIEEIKFVRQLRYKQSDLEYILLNIKGIDRIPKKWQFTSKRLGLAKQTNIEEPFLAFDLGLTTLRLWECYVLARRYYGLAIGVPYVPTKFLLPDDSDFGTKVVSIDARSL